MTSFESFRLFVKKHRDNITVKGTPSQWPYNYGTSIAYNVTFQNVTQYFYFNSEGALLVKKVLTDNSN